MRYSGLLQQIEGSGYKDSEFNRRAIASSFDGGEINGCQRDFFLYLLKPKKERIQFNTKRVPWHFGMLPTEYIGSKETTTPQVMRYLSDNRSGDIFNEWYSLTLKCPPIRVIDANYLFHAGIKPGDFTSVLIACHAKPGGAISIEEGMLSTAIAALKNIGIACMPHKELDNEFKEHDMVYASFHPGILPFFKTQYPGIFYGFPLADVIECETPSHLSLDGHGLIKPRDLEFCGYIITDQLWSRYWKDNMGFRAEKHLSGVYRDLLNRSGFIKWHKEEARRHDSSKQTSWLQRILGKKHL